MTLDWKALAARIDDMSLRERAMLFGSISLVILVLAHVVLLDPLLRQQKTLVDRIGRDQSQLNAVRAQLEQVVKGSDGFRHPDEVAIEALEHQIAEAERAVATRQGAFIAPERLPALLRDIVKRSRGVQLQSLRVLPGVPVRLGPVESGVYRHGVELALQGSYFDLLRYLEELEKRSTELLWGQVELRVTDYPQVELRVVIQTLSLNASLLAI
jgi:MSHA biogenesis protein MshJ